MELYRLLLEAEEEKFDVNEALAKTSLTEVKRNLATASKARFPILKGVAILLILKGVAVLGYTLAELPKGIKQAGEDLASALPSLFQTVVTALVGLSFFYASVKLWKLESVNIYDIAYILKEAKGDKPSSLQSIKNFIKKVWNKLVSFAKKAYGWFKQKVGVTVAVIATAFAAAGLALILYLKSKGHSVSEVYHTALETIKHGRAAKIVIGAAVMVVLALGAYVVFKTRGQKKTPLDISQVDISQAEVVDVGLRKEKEKKEEGK